MRGVHSDPAEHVAVQHTTWEWGQGYDVRHLPTPERTGLARTRRRVADGRVTVSAGVLRQAVAIGVGGDSDGPIEYSQRPAQAVPPCQEGRVAHPASSTRRFFTLNTSGLEHPTATLRKRVHQRNPESAVDLARPSASRCSILKRRARPRHDHGGLHDARATGELPAASNPPCRSWCPDSAPTWPVIQRSVVPTGAVRACGQDLRPRSEWLREAQHHCLKHRG